MKNKTEETLKIKIIRPCVAKGKITAKGTVLSMKVSEARPFLRTGKAVPAKEQQKDKE